MERERGTEPASVGAASLEGVGATALLTAAARALATERGSGLVADPWARSLAGDEGFALLEAGEGPRTTDGTPLYVVRHRYIDDVLQDLTRAGGASQVVLLAAGLDTRAFRLDWPDGLRLYEVDQPPVLAYKDAVLDAQAAIPRCERITVPADLRENWSQALLARGYDRDRLTVWIAEGLLFYLPETAVHEVLDTARRLSPAGSNLVADMMSATAGPPQRFKDLFASWGAPFLSATDDPVELMRACGWDADAIPNHEVGRRLGVEFPPELAASGWVLIART